MLITCKLNLFFIYIEFRWEKTLIKWIIGILAASTFGFSGVAKADCGYSDPIIIPLHNWSSQIVMSHTVGQLFEKIGCNVQYITTDSEAVYESIRTGDVTIELEVWEGAFGPSFNAALDKGGILDAGTHDAITREDWWLPDFVIEMCPGLPNWEALDSCSDMFVRENSNGKGVYIDGPVEWLHDQKLAKNLGMNFEIRNVSGASDLWHELDKAHMLQKPIVIFNWSPNFTDALYGGQFVEFPPFEDACLTDPSWGPNPNATGDCGRSVGGYLKKAAHYKMPVKWPAAYKALTRINFTTKMIGTLAMYVDIYGLEHADAASRWILENPDIWEPWLYEE